MDINVSQNMMTFLGTIFKVIFKVSKGDGHQNKNYLTIVITLAGLT